MSITVTSLIEQKTEEQLKWEPNEKQKKFIQVPFDVDEAGYGGALGAGKTDVLMMLPLCYQFHENGKFKGIMFRRTYPELEQEVIPRSYPFYSGAGAIYNYARHRWEWPNGAMFSFGHLKDEKDVKKYDTGQFSYIGWDEATSFTGYQYEYITLRRNRSAAGSGLPAFTRWGSNPGNVGHAYFRKRFIDPCKSGGKIIFDRATNSKRLFIPATAEDNPHLLAANPKYFEKLKGIKSEAERRAMILGDWYTFEGQVFDEWRLEPMHDEPEIARHVIEPFVIPNWWPKIVGIDWGFAALTYVIWAAISPDGRVYIYRTYGVKKTKIKDWTRDIALLSAGEMDNIRDVRICWSAIQDRGHDQTIFEQVAESLSEAGFNCGLTMGDKNRIAGKQLVHEYIRWTPLKSIKSTIGEYDAELANRIMRMSGTEAMKEYAKYYEPEMKELNIPKLQVFSTSPEGVPSTLLTEAIANCVYDDVKVEDVKEFEGDDPYDCLRIVLNGVRDYFAESSQEHTKQQRIGMANAKLAESGDQTSYYINIARIEANETESISVRRMSGMSRSRRGIRR